MCFVSWLVPLQVSHPPPMWSLRWRSRGSLWIRALPSPLESLFPDLFSSLPSTVRPAHRSRLGSSLTFPTVSKGPLVLVLVRCRAPQFRAQGPWTRASPKFSRHNHLPSRPCSSRSSYRCRRWASSSSLLLNRSSRSCWGRVHLTTRDCSRSGHMFVMFLSLQPASSVIIIHHSTSAVDSASG